MKSKIEQALLEEIGEPPAGTKKRTRRKAKPSPPQANGKEEKSSPRSELAEEAQVAAQTRVAVEDGPPEAAASPPPDGAAQDPVEWQRAFFEEYRVRRARIPRRFAKKTLKSFKTVDRLRRDLVAGARDFIRKFGPDLKTDYPKGLLMTGPVGSGKSHLAVAILREVAAKGHTVLYYNSPDLLRDIRATFNSDGGMTEDDLLEEIAAVDLFVLDDLGAENISGFVLDRLYLIINKRYEDCRPMILTTNLEREELFNRLGKRIVSRFDEMCRVFGPFPEEDYRRRMLKSSHP